MGDEIARVTLMATDGHPTWDLSPKDCAALRALLARLRDAERELAEARAPYGWRKPVPEDVHARVVRELDEARNGKAGINDILQTLHAQVAEMCAFAGASPDAPQDSWTLRDRLVVLVRERTRDDHDYVVACRERDEARAALIRAQEDHRAVVEALETYEERIGDIADHVLGLVPSGTPTVVKLDAIERRCGEERIAARQAEARVAELKGIVSDYEELHDPLVAIADAAEALRDATRARLTGAVEDALSKVDAALAARKDGGR